MSDQTKKSKIPLLKSPRNSAAGSPDTVTAKPITPKLKSPRKNDSDSSYPATPSKLKSPRKSHADSPVSVKPLVPVPKSPRKNYSDSSHPARASMLKSPRKGHVDSPVSMLKNSRQNSFDTTNQDRPPILKSLRKNPLDLPYLATPLTPVLKSRSKMRLDSPYKGKGKSPTPNSNAGTTKVLATRKIPLSPLTIQDYSKMDEKMAPNKVSNFESPDKKPISVAVSHRRSSSYSEQYSKKPKQTEVMTVMREQEILTSKIQEEEKEMPKEQQRVDFLLDSPKGSQEKLELKPISSKSMDMEISVDVEMKVPENSVEVEAWVLEDYIKDEVFLVKKLDYLVDHNVNKIEIQIPESKENVSVAFIEKPVDSLESISFLKPAHKVKSKEPEYTSEGPFAADFSNSEDEKEDNEDFLAMKNEIFEAVAKQNIPEKVTSVEKPTARSILKKVSHLVENKKVEKKSKKLDSKKSEKEIPLVKVKTDLKSHEEPKVPETKILDFISDPSESHLKVNGNQSKIEIIEETEIGTTESPEGTGIQKEKKKMTKEQARNLELLEGFQIDMTIDGREEICTGIRKEKEKMTKEQARRLELQGFQTKINKGHEVLDKVESNIGCYKGILLTLFLGFVISGMVFLAWSVLEQHCEYEPPKKRSYMGSIIDWIFGFTTSNPVTEETPQKHFWNIF